MKSAYELAMERLQASDPDTAAITDEQRKQLAELDEKYKAKIAEREVFLTQQIATEEGKGNRQEAEQVREQLRRERLRLEEERDAKKEAVREQ